MARKVHFVGIGGVGMAGLAVLYHASGETVSGCDVKASPRTGWLESLGIPVAIGHDPRHVESSDLVIATPAVASDEPERMVAKRVVVRGEALAELFNARPDTIAVCGSHGKTTTATWIAKLLVALGEDVAWCIGGETREFPVARAGKGPLVVEADESDGTLALYRAKTLVVTNCEYDHPDYFKSFEAYVACYDAARRQAGTVIEGGALAEGDWERSAGGWWEALPAHNRINARTAVEVARRRGHALAAILEKLPEIVAVLPDRRFQRIGDGVYVDYAHHPTETACAIGMARAVCRGKLRVLFQPHRYSRTRALAGAFAASFRGADEVVLCPTYAAFEKPVEGGDVADLYKACRESGESCRWLLARSCEEAWTHAVRSRDDGDVTLVLGAGDVVSKLKALPPREILIGMGSNTWKSDLDLGETYRRTEGPADRAGATLGIPWMAGVPGTIGGWVKMNAGAFGHSISELVRRVKVDGKWIPKEDCGFAYRRSGIEGEIEDVEFGPIPEDATDYLAKRPKFPAGTWGSFFKNPEGDFAGRLLEAAGAKELRVGGAYVWEEHANVIVAGKDATPSDVLALARLMRARVRFRFGVSLEPEVKGVEVGYEH